MTGEVILSNNCYCSCYY